MAARTALARASRTMLRAPMAGMGQIRALSTARESITATETKGTMGSFYTLFGASRMLEATKSNVK